MVLNVVETRLGGLKIGCSLFKANTAFRFQAAARRWLQQNAMMRWVRKTPRIISSFGPIARGDWRGCGDDVLR